MFYNGKKAGSFFSREVDQVGEPSIREEIKKIFETEGRASYYIYRRARRDENGLPIISPTRMNNRSREVNMDVPTSASETMGYLFDDYMVLGYFAETYADHEAGRMLPAGDSRHDDKALYLQWDVLSSITDNLFDMPDEIDQIIVPKFDVNGNIGSPLRVEELYNIISVEPYRLDGNGRIEYHKLNLLSEHERSFQL